MKSISFRSSSYHWISPIPSYFSKLYLFSNSFSKIALLLYFKIMILPQLPMILFPWVWKISNVNTFGLNQEASRSATKWWLLNHLLIIFGLLIICHEASWLFTMKAPNYLSQGPLRGQDYQKSHFSHYKFIIIFW